MKGNNTMQSEQNSTTSLLSPAPFNHPNNITFGEGHFVRDGVKYSAVGRVLFAGTPTRPQGGRLLEPGWVLPGGVRTLDRAEAIAVAETINRLSTTA